ncbi:MAG: hypothetical protein M3063_16780 [Actinomycetota bacterium]|nr:hypothetical protein [Actinomycetota bacterium]
MSGGAQLVRAWRLVAGAGLAALLGACGAVVPPLAGPGQLPVKVQHRPAVAAPAARQPVASATSSTAPAASPLGTAITVNGPDGAQASVNVAAIVDPAAPAYSYDAAGSGQRFLAVKLKVTDTGDVALQENALEDTTLVDSTGASQTPVVTEAAGCATIVGGEIALGPHSTQVQTCVTFELPSTSTVKVVHVSLGRNVAGQGSWSPS